jgi:hypothetical protein
MPDHVVMAITTDQPALLCSSVPQRLQPSLHNSVINIGFPQVFPQLP